MPGAGGHHVPEKGGVVLVEMPVLGSRVGIRDSHQALQVILETYPTRSFVV